MILDVLAGRRFTVPPVWLMRQAGRYLPEYRAIREKVPSFLDLCFTPELAADVTLQPVRRFNFDAAILFSDILIVPYGLGQKVEFLAGEGPKLGPVVRADNVSRFIEKMNLEVLAPIFETIRIVRTALPARVTLLGFCGAPWTVATYMVAGGSSSDQAPARLLAYRDSETFGRLIGSLVDASIDYLVAQFEAGVDAVQIFDTWAGVLTPEEFDAWCIEPTRRVVEGVRKRVGNAAIIGFPRGAGTMVRRYALRTGVNAVGLDWSIDRIFARDTVQSEVAVQGNLDPLALLAGGDALNRGVDAVLDAFAERPFIFNLGHGILPETPIAHVEQMLRRVRGG